MQKQTKSNTRLRQRLGHVRAALRAYGCEDNEGVPAAVARLIAEHEQALKEMFAAQAWADWCLLERTEAYRLRDQAQESGSIAVRERQRAQAAERFYRAGFNQLLDHMSRLGLEVIPVLGVDAEAQAVGYAGPVGRLVPTDALRAPPFVRYTAEIVPMNLADAFDGLSGRFVTGTAPLERDPGPQPDENGVVDVTGSFTPDQRAEIGGSDAHVKVQVTSLSQRDELAKVLAQDDKGKPR